MNAQAQAAPSAEERQARAANNVAQIRDTMRFDPRQSHPTMQVKKTLDSYYAQKILAVSYAQLSYRQYNLAVLLRLMGASRADVSSVEETLDALYEKSFEFIGEQIDQQEVLLKANNISESVTYSKTRSYELRVLTPQDNRFLALIQQADILFRTVDTLWLYGAYTSQQRLKACNLFQGHLFDLLNRIARLYVRARNAAGRQQEIRRQRDEASDRAAAERRAARLANGAAQASDDTLDTEDEEAAAEAAARTKAILDDSGQSDADDVDEDDDARMAAAEAGALKDVTDGDEGQDATEAMAADEAAEAAEAVKSTVADAADKPAAKKAATKTAAKKAATA